MAEAATPTRREHLQVLVDRLRTLEIVGQSRGGPHRGIEHNDVTRAIVAEGEDVVPLLIARLPESGFDESVYIVFLLRELRASEAEPAIRRLQAEADQRSEGHDLTLKMQITYFLMDCSTW